jgi:dTDP-4-dehydrorhamnose reductase
MYQNVMVTGATGQLGSELVKRLGSRAIPVTHRELDITDRAAVRRWVQFEKPDAVVNCAAYTQVDAAEFRNPELCHMVNCEGVKNLVTAGIPAFIQISSDYVFDGRSRQYTEESTCRPLNIYGHSKVRAEEYLRAARDQLENYFIIRTSGLFVAGHKNFVTNIIEQAEAGKKIRVANDLTTRITYVPHLVSAIIHFLDTPPGRGTYHIANTGSASWYEYACFILAQLNRSVECEPVSISALGGAPRPRSSVLNLDKYTGLWSPPQMPGWKNAIKEFFNERV